MALERRQQGRQLVLVRRRLPAHSADALDANASASGVPMTSEKYAGPRAICLVLFAIIAPILAVVVGVL